MFDQNWIDRLKAKSEVKDALKSVVVTPNVLHEAKANLKAESYATPPDEEPVEQATGRISPQWPQTAEESGLLPPFKWDASQADALRRLAAAPYGALIGAAGTGKTTLVKALAAKIIYGDPELGLEPQGIVDLGEGQGPSIAFVAFTGIASQVISQALPAWLAPACKTIHSLLEYKPANLAAEDEEGKETSVNAFVPTRNRHNKLNIKVLVVDEASMLGLDLWHNLLDALRPGVKVILIGDLNQLKPVADQTMFAYALAESLRPNPRWVVAELTTIHRQKEPAANRIIETAHDVLNGRKLTFDNPADPNWRVIGFELASNPDRALNQIVGMADKLRKATVHPTIDPETPPYYQPYMDRIMTAGNGDDPNNTSSLVQQVPINEFLCRIIEPPTAENPIYIIDAGTTQKRFATGHRVMATKNEPPSTKDRVTNGMTGRVTEIRVNPSWSGILGSVGPEEEVREWRSQMARRALDGVKVTAEESHAELEADFSSFNVAEILEEKQKNEEESGGRFGAGPASHIVVVRFDNGAVREFRSKAQVMQLQLAYATTVHKAQGSQCDTAIIVCHQAAKSQLSREWLYTAVTRARKRVVLLYTPFGLQTAIHKQQIFGRTLAEKILRYKQAMEEGTGGRNGVVRLTVEEL